jgi:1-acyl-sn-glycerol-3-phosphate acyltransferase
VCFHLFALVKYRRYSPTRARYAGHFTAFFVANCAKMVYKALMATDASSSSMQSTLFPPVAVLRVALATLSLYLFAYLLTALAVLLACLAALVRWTGFLKPGTVAWAHLLFWLTGRRLHLLGRENMAPGATYLVVANHSSMYDIPALMAAVPGIAIMGRDYLMRIPAFGTLLRMLHYVPIDTSSPTSARNALKAAARSLQAGISLGIFPEGTRTETGEIQQLKRGFVSVLKESGIDLLPVHIRGTFALKPKGKLTLNPRERIEVSIGAPVPNGDLALLSDREIMEKVRSILKDMQKEQR